MREFGEKLLKVRTRVFKRFQTRERVPELGGVFLAAGLADVGHELLLDSAGGKRQFGITVWRMDMPPLSVETVLRLSLTSNVMSAS